MRGEGDAEAAKLFVMHSVKIRTSTHSSVACVLMEQLLWQSGRDGHEPGQRFLPYMKTPTSATR